MITMFKNNLNILVVGGAGYIGSHVVHELIEKEFNVTVYDNFSTGCKENLPHEASIVKGDILNRIELLLICVNSLLSLTTCVLILLLTKSSLESKV